MSEACCSATLIVLGESLDPDVVTELLGLTPDQSWRKGEAKSAAGVSFESVYEWGGWKRFVSPEFRDSELQEQVEHWVCLFDEREEALKRLGMMGLTLELNCFTATSLDLSLSAPTLGRLADWGVRLAIRFSSIQAEAP